jgi:hypothetical protein
MVDFEEMLEAPSDEQLSVVSGLIKRQVEIEDWIKNEEGRLKEAKANLAKIQNELLPEAMLNAGVTEFADENGFKVSVKTDVKAGITSANQEWCFNWLRKSGNGDIIRNEFKISYGVGEEDRAKELVDELKNQGQDFNQKQYVHPRTLPAFCRAELEDNQHSEEWENKFGIYRYKVAKIERPS